MAQQDFPDKLEQIYAIAIHAYGRMKSFGKCEDLIEDMRDKNITPSNAIYTTLLEAYCRHNVVEKGLILFRQMKLDGSRSKTNTLFIIRLLTDLLTRPQAKPYYV
jgi:pentatricopeptide repeat protein